MQNQQEGNGASPKPLRGGCGGIQPRISKDNLQLRVQFTNVRDESVERMQARLSREKKKKLSFL
jgi:hypothetical protein